MIDTIFKSLNTLDSQELENFVNFTSHEIFSSTMCYKCEFTISKKADTIYFFIRNKYYLSLNLNPIAYDYININYSTAGTYSLKTNKVLNYLRKQQIKKILK